MLWVLWQFSQIVDNYCQIIVETALNVNIILAFAHDIALLAPTPRAIVVNLPRVEPWSAPSEWSVLDLGRDGSPSISGRCMEGVQIANLSRASAQIRTDSPRFTFVPSLFIVRSALLKYTHLLLFIYKRNRLRRINFLSTERQQRLKKEHYVHCKLFSQRKVTIPS